MITNIPVTLGNAKKPVRAPIGAAKRLFLVGSILFVIGAASAYADDTYTSGKSNGLRGDSMFYGQSLFTAGEMSLGVGYVTNWGGGFNLTGSYFLFDDVAVQVDYASLSYRWGWDTTSVTYIDVAGVYHRALGQTDKGWDFGWYGGLGLAVAKATSTYPGHDYSTSTDLGGLFWLAGLEMKFNRNVRAHVGVGSLSLGVGVDFSF